ncbi:isoleucine--tRNA ligase [uncultured Cytophaga sp.]|uniref:isoleucine--tRNA ligase n=1 Tax=uncultured Cytophaga sp. TaxID=160238 RepID=UPI002616D1F5|nr:isoleucine--tRNA ligase [uncultured Cytophaga sp.]
MKYNEKKTELSEVGNEIQQFWKDNNIFEKSIDTREGKPTFTFYEGPPSANGTPGIHHVMGRTVKDIFCRFKTMQGFQVKRKGGWDTHGLPVELQVEKELGITKEDIGKKISVEEYNKKCRESVMKYKSEWDELTVKMGYWVDLEKPYITFENNYIESVWHLLKQFHSQNLLYKGYTIQPYSPAAGTGLSSHELNQPGTYKDVRDTSAVAQFKLKPNSKIQVPNATEETYFIAWTTTPWTLPSNSALAVGENIEYVLVSTFNPYTFLPIQVILAKALMGKYFSDKAKDISLEEYTSGDKLIPFKLISSFKGKDLVGVEYEQLMPYLQPDTAAFRVIAGDFVSTEDGTGIVHIAPTFGADDARVAKQAGIPSIVTKDDRGNEYPLVDRQGRFTKEVTDFAGEYVKEAYLTDEEKEVERNKQGRDKYLSVDERISIKLKEANRAFKVERYEHSYPHCWRTDKPVLYYPLDSWFIKTTAKKDRLVELNKSINWKPESTGTGRFGNWLENLVDWNLSRSRYWGTPLPIWRTEDGSEEKCIGSIEELKAEIAKAQKAGIETATEINDLHRPYVDNIVLLSDSGKPMKRELDLIDVWFDSGAMPYAQWHYPFENKELFDNNYPADFIAEGVDQTRGWFFTLHAISGMLFDKVAFKNVIANGLVLDKNGNKMSKRLGNVVNPFETIDKYGPDATRWYMITNAQPWDNLKFNLDGITEVQRRFFGTLQNTYSFFALYANLDNFSFAEAEIPLKERTESDRWVLSKLQSLIKEVGDAFADYEPTKAGRAIQDFVVDDLSNWYVRLNRKRFWKGEYNADKTAAYQTLYTCLETVAKLGAPIAPFYLDKLFRDLNEVSKKNTVSSVHLADFPKVTDAYLDLELEERMSLAQRVSSLVHSIRKSPSVNIKVRQPLSRILIPILQPRLKAQIQAVEDLIKNEVNIKTIEYIEDTSGIVVKTIKPNFKKLGKEYGAKLKEIGNAIATLSADDITTIERGTFDLKLADGAVIAITAEDVEIRSQDIPGWSVASEAGLTVALDITLSDELKQEGIARDVVNRVQNMRKDMGLEVQDKIRISIQRNDELINSALRSNQEYICTETQALSLDIVDVLTGGTEIEMDEQTLIMKIEK